MPQKFIDNADMKLLQPLFPPGTQCVLSADPPDGFRLHPSERKNTARMAPTRYRDYCHGRACARLALERLELADSPVPTGEHREPIWPDSVVGSLSHTQHFAAAVVARTEDVLALGVDLEPHEELPADILARICREEEIHRLRADGDLYRQAKIIFSAKESLYKCLWPELRTFIGFRQMEITLTEHPCSWSAISHTEKCPPELIARLQGHYLMTEDLIISSAYILPSETTAGL